MVKICVAHVIVFMVSADLAAPFIQNDTIGAVANQMLSVKTRRQETKSKKKDKSTSSSKDRGAESDGSSESLNLSTDGKSSTSSSGDHKKRKNKYKPKSSAERKGWRKWHRKCTPCPEDQVKKWRDPSIKWICGGFQRARRSFKSLCMMHYRNCQDGTMFVKIHDHRCTNDTGRPIGDHFFYDYQVVLTDDDSNSESTGESSQKSSSSSAV